MTWWYLPTRYLLSLSLCVSLIYGGYLYDDLVVGTYRHFGGYLRLGGTCLRGTYSLCVSYMVGTYDDLAVGT